MDCGVCRFAAGRKREGGKVAVARFGEATKQAGLSSTSRIIEASFGGAAGKFGQIARRFDLSVVGQSEPTRAAAEDLLDRGGAVRIGASGRGRSLHPQGGAQARSRPGVLGSRPKRDACDRRRHAVSGAGQERRSCQRSRAKDTKHDEPSGAIIVDHLTRHGLKAEINHIVPNESDIASHILSLRRIGRGFSRHGRLRPFASARIYPRRRDARDIGRDDGSDADVALTFTRSGPRGRGRDRRAELKA